MEVQFELINFKKSVLKQLKPGEIEVQVPGFIQHPTKWLKPGKVKDSSSVLHFRDVK